MDRSADTAKVTMAPADDLIDIGGMGRVQVGSTLEDARRTYPSASFTRETDGDGATLVGLTVVPHAVLILYAAEEQADSIEWTKRIENIETFSPVYHTAAGVHPGSLVEEVERVYGKVKVINLSEIESREFATFSNQPAGMTFRIDDSGDFPEGSWTTTRYRNGAKILSIAVP